MCFPPDSCTRQCCKAIAASAWFENTVIVLICLSSLCMAMERPSLPKDSQERMI